MKYIELRSITEPLAIEANEYWGSFFKGMAEKKQLLMLGWSGMYWLVPHEAMSECVTIMDQRQKSLEVFNAPPPVTISIEQCIPIPSETAKILLEL